MQVQISKDLFMSNLKKGNKRPTTHILFKTRQKKKNPIEQQNKLFKEFTNLAFAAYCNNSLSFIDPFRDNSNKLKFRQKQVAMNAAIKNSNTKFELIQSQIITKNEYNKLGLLQKFDVIINPEKLKNLQTHDKLKLSDCQNKYAPVLLQAEKTMVQQTIEQMKNSQSDQKKIKSNIQKKFLERYPDRVQTCDSSIKTYKQPHLKNSIQIKRKSADFVWTGNSFYSKSKRRCFGSFSSGLSENSQFCKSEKDKSFKYINYISSSKQRKQFISNSKKRKNNFCSKLKKSKDNILKSSKQGTKYRHDLKKCLEEILDKY